MRVNSGHRRAFANPDAEFFKRHARGAAKPLGKRRQDGRPGFHKHDPRTSRVDRAELVSERLARNLSQGAGKFHARGPAAHDHEGE